MSKYASIKSSAVKIACSILTGALLYLSFPPVDLWWLSFIALVPFLLILRQVDSTLKVVLFAGIAGLSFYVPGLVWLASVAVAGWLLLAVYVTFYFCLFAAAARLCDLKAHRLYFLLLPTIWVAIEFIRATIFTGFPWFLFGFTQYRFSQLLQMASVTGVYGLSFVLVFFNTALAELIRSVLGTKSKISSEPLKYAMAWWGGAVLLILVVFSYGSFISGRISLETGPVLGVVQHNMPPELPPPDIQQIYRLSAEDVEHLSNEERQRLRRRLRQYHEEVQQIRREGIDKAVRLSYALADKEPVLIAWPETAVDTPLNPGAEDSLSLEEKRKREYAREKIRTLANDLGCYILVGSTNLKNVDRYGGRTANTAYLFSPDGDIVDYYDKIRLVPFGEYTPARNLLPRPLVEFLESMAIAQSIRGGEAVVFPEPFPFGAPICYDNVFSTLMRRFRLKGAEVLINISNEGWYQIRGELEQHLGMAVFRAVETRTTVARATNTGISAFINPKGEIYGMIYLEKNGRKITSDIEGSIALPVKLSDEIPFYTRFGDWFAVLCLSLSIVLLIVMLLRRVKQSQ